jgi:AraC family transcriptional regulator
VNTARTEYVARINRVIDHIDANLGGRLSLAELAGVAGFSPFYFHRIFGAMVGETLSQFIRRLRVERAAAQLIGDPKKPITAIALECGFSGSAPFARAFKESFGMSASDWRRSRSRRGQDDDDGASCSEDGKDRQTLGKIRKDWEVTSPYAAGAQHRLTWRVAMIDRSTVSGRVEVREAPELTVAYVRHTGPYQGDGELFGRLFGKLMQWAGPRGLCLARRRSRSPSTTTTRG